MAKDNVGPLVTSCRAWAPAVKSHGVAVHGRPSEIRTTHGLEATFSTLRRHIATIGDKRIATTYPSTLGASAAPIIRLARRLLANS